MHLITLEQTLILHQGIMLQSNGTTAIRDKSILESAIAQPNMTYDSVFLYPSLIEKVCALGFSLINNHPFVDGNKRIGHAAMEVTLLINGYEIKADIDNQEQIILAVASSSMKREELLHWLQQSVYSCH